ncbi:hypothetical protein TO73_0576 [Thermus aquaticus Y51MC23]|uniref:Uncharacterized protein n=1 Tax=Thermus aquaticus (strain ATCC BAA-2747 / Y51MC23) TaxID=498848 RepID=A0ABM5VK13_THEA5|nr:hypothetical protein TO73_0576 [Thermus aquaticus Y51MC23]
MVSQREVPKSGLRAFLGYLRIATGLPLGVEAIEWGECG